MSSPASLPTLFFFFLPHLLDQAGTLVNVFYSNPTLYADAKHQEGLAWTVKTDDFFPYADGEHAYWTGYFTSRPLLKGFERYTSSWLQVHSCRCLRKSVAPNLEFYGDGRLSFEQCQDIVPVSSLLLLKPHTRASPSIDIPLILPTHVPIFAFPTQGARHLEVLSKQGPMQEQRSTLATLEAASAVNQHHDAVICQCRI